MNHEIDLSHYLKFFEDVANNYNATSLQETVTQPVAQQKVLKYNYVKSTFDNLTTMAAGEELSLAKKREEFVRAYEEAVEEVKSGNTKKKMNEADIFRYVNIVNRAYQDNSRKYLDYALFLQLYGCTYGS